MGEAGSLAASSTPGDVLIAAADHLGKSLRPLVCTNGCPSVAALRLLTGLAEGGTSIHVRADDDTAGQAIVATVRGRSPTRNSGASKPGPPVCHATRNRTCASSCRTYAATAPDTIR